MNTNREKEFPVNRMIRLTAAVLALGAALSAQAQVKVENAWVRATVPSQKATGAFMQLTAPADMRLIGASSSKVPIVEVHEMAMENDVMKMRQISAVALPAGRTVELRPGGYHLMLLNLKNQVKAGETVPLTLTFEVAGGKRETIDIDAMVRPLNTSAAPLSPGNLKH